MASASGRQPPDPPAPLEAGQNPVQGAGSDRNPSKIPDVLGYGIPMARAGRQAAEDEEGRIGEAAETNKGGSHGRQYIV